MVSPIQQSTRHVLANTTWPLEAVPIIRPKHHLKQTDIPPALLISQPIPFSGHHPLHPVDQFRFKGLTPRQSIGSWLSEAYTELSESIQDFGTLHGNTRRVLTKRLGELFNGSWEVVKRQTVPTRLSALQSQIVPYVEQSPVGFPKALVRAHAIRSENPNAYQDYSALCDANSRKTRTSKDLIKQHITSEAQAYLGAHLVGFENALVTSRERFFQAKTGYRTIDMAMDDANGIVARRRRQLYGNDTRLVRDDLYRLIFSMPKVNLHEHARGSIAIPLIRSWLIDQLHPNSYRPYEYLQEYYRVERQFSKDGRGPTYRATLNTYRKRNDITQKAVNTPAEFYLAAYLFTLKAGLENVRYFEYRFGPMSGRKPDETHNEIAFKNARAMQQGIDDAAAFMNRYRNQSVEGNLIFTAYRHNYSEDLPKKDPDKARKLRVEAAIQVVKSAIECRKNGLRVTGIDFAGDEAHYAITDYGPVADILKAHNRQQFELSQKPDFKGDDGRIGATIHAGETPLSGLLSHPKQQPLSGMESVQKSIEMFLDVNIDGKPYSGKEAYQLYREGKISDQTKIETVTPVRIGHGIRAIQSPTLMAFCRRFDIGFEQCPKSNVQTAAIAHREDFPAVSLVRDKILVNICRDNSTTSKTNSCNELIKVTRYNGANHQDRKQFQLDGLKMAFQFDRQKKQALIDEMQRTFKTLERIPEFQTVIEMETQPEERPLLLNQPDRSDPS